MFRKILFLMIISLFMSSTFASIAGSLGKALLDTSGRTALLGKVLSNGNSKDYFENSYKKALRVITGGKTTRVSQKQFNALIDGVDSSKFSQSMKDELKALLGKEAKDVSEEDLKKMRYQLNNLARAIDPYGTFLGSCKDSCTVAPDGIDADELFVVPNQVARDAFEDNASNIDGGINSLLNKAGARDYSPSVLRPDSTDREAMLAYAANAASSADTHTVKLAKSIHKLNGHKNKLFRLVTDLDVKSHGHMATQFEEIAKRCKNSPKMEACFYTELRVQSLEANKAKPEAQRLSEKEIDEYIESMRTKKCFF